MKNNTMMLVKKYGLKIVILCFWLLVWKVVSLAVHQEILLAAPDRVLKTLGKLSQSVSFWLTILHTTVRIILGFLFALVIGIILAVISYNIKIINELITPLMKVIKVIPIASFIILALIWIDKSENLSVVISFYMVLPVIYTNVLQGLSVTDEKLLQMAKVFRLKRVSKITAIYLPSVIPYIISACSIGLGFCWKAGISAEVIGITRGSIGEKLYEAKLYLLTEELFAWTFVIIIISLFLERLFMLMIRLMNPEAYDKAQEIKAQKL